MKKSVIKRDQLVKGRTYLLDNYSKSTGIFEDMTEDDNWIRIRFKCTNNCNYYVSQGFITFKFKKGDTNIVFYQEISEVQQLINKY